jgi:2-polyprenyl-3-methyl-5-hydroxy-6-metoxy-1,4-benzoquinol methylase
MSSRGCPFCHSKSSHVIGTRADVWARCRNCRSIFRDITSASFKQIHEEGFQDTACIDSTIAFASQRPLRALWDLLALPGSAVLEIGPGSGHLLAAARQAGCVVTAVESSKVHRDFIRDAWGIRRVYATLDEVPAERAFDTIVAINVLAHIYDIVAFLGAIRRMLAPGGTCYLSTANALSLEATVLGPWWSVCKVHDHVSFPSAAGLATAALESGLRVGQIWSTGLPFEFPVSALVAARDRARTVRVSGAHAAAAGAVTLAPPARGRQLRRTTTLTNFYSAAALFDPGYRVLGALGRAGSLKARLTR